MEKKIFWVRLGIYVTFGALIPFIFLVWRFQLFNKVNQISIRGWGIVAAIFVAAFFIKLIKMVKEGLPYSTGTQVLEGLCKVTIPLIVAAFCAYYMQDLMDQVFQFLAVLIFCETIAVVANPLPAWVHENKLEEEEDRTKKIFESLGILKENEKK